MLAKSRALTSRYADHCFAKGVRNPATIATRFPLDSMRRAPEMNGDSVEGESLKPGPGDVKRGQRR
jgi:hypothetical protein